MNISMPGLPYALLDPITYLPNRQNFIENYATAGVTEGTLLMVTMADAGHYNQILRALGHEYGENFVRAGAARIRGIIPADIVMYHTSILSFAAIVMEDAEGLAARLIAALDAPLDCGGIPISTRAGVGLAHCRASYGADLLRTALVAAQDSRNGGPGWAHYDSRRDAAHRRGFLLVSQLGEAVRASNQLSLGFQPKFNMATRRATGVEALIRWDHPQLGPIPPAEFIPMVEATALINPLTDWVLNRALGQLAEWHGQGYFFAIAINISPQNLIRTDFSQKMAAAIERHQVDPRFIEIEFSESAMVSQNEAIVEELRRVRALGVQVALDEFGTGFFNLNYVANLPLDIIKIDRAMLRRIDVDERSGLLVRTLIQLAHRLEYRVVADGIETAEVYRLLKSWHCDEGQGFFMSRVLTKSEFAAWMPLHQPVRRVA